MTLADRSRNELRAAMERYGAATPDELYRMRRAEARVHVGELVQKGDVDGLIELCIADSHAFNFLYRFRYSHADIVHQVVRACYAEVN